MKKIMLLALSLHIINTANAQFYLRGGLGIAFPQAGQTMDGATSVYNGMVMPLSGVRTNGATTIGYNIKNASFSSGTQGILGLGYLFSDHMGVQLDANLGLSPTLYTFSDKLTNVYYSSGALSSNVTVEQQAKSPIILMPSLVLQTGGDKWNIYSRFGLALPLSAKITQDLILANAPGTGVLTTLDYTFQLKSYFSPGFTAAAGTQYKLNEHFSIWGELSILSLSLSVKESDLTGFSINEFKYPVDQGGVPVHVAYSKSVTIDSTGAMAPTYTQPFSNFGIHFGVTYWLSSRSRSNNGMLDNGTKRKKF